MRFRFATPADASLLAAMNASLIKDEGHRNPMGLDELTSRMAGWLSGDYSAVLFLDQGESPVGYALFRPDGDAVYLRQLFVEASSRRRGVGSAALRWLREHAWSGASRVRVDVLIGNLAALSFWRSAGFADYCITLECDL